MKQDMSLSLIKKLALFSLLTLLFFLIYWNVQNFNTAKQELHQGLSEQMELACSQYRDSVVQVFLKVLDKPEDHKKGQKQDGFFLQTEKKGRTIWQNEIGMRMDSIANDTSVHSLRVFYFDSLSTQDRFPSRDVVAWTKGVSGRFNLEFQQDNSSDTFVVVERSTSLRNFPERIGPSLSSTYHIIDTLFRQKLILNNLPLKYDILDTSDSKRSLNIPFAYSSLGITKNPIASFANTRAYILAQIINPLMASIVLFSMVGLSFFLVFRNIAAQRRLSGMKNEFISNMTHELKTPISTVGVALEALEKFGASEDPQKKKEYMDICRHEVDRLSTLVNKVMRLSFNDQTEQKLTLTPINLEDIVNDTIGSLKLLLDKKEIQYEQDIEGGDYHLQGDKLHLTNVIYNLIDNAIKYSPQKSMIKLTLLDHPQSLLLSLSDQGDGIAKEYQSKIFDRFFRVPTDNVHDIKGHGLGLHYVRSIVEAHKGKISVESKEDIGSTFTIQLPKNG